MVSMLVQTKTLNMSLMLWTLVPLSHWLVLLPFVVGAGDGAQGTGARGRSPWPLAAGLAALVDLFSPFYFGFHFGETLPEEQGEGLASRLVSSQSTTNGEGMKSKRKGEGMPCSSCRSHRIGRFIIFFLAFLFAGDGGLASGEPCRYGDSKKSKGKAQGDGLEAFRARFLFSPFSLFLAICCNISLFTIAGKGAHNNDTVGVTVSPRPTYPNPSADAGDLLVDKEPQGQ